MASDSETRRRLIDALSAEYEVRELIGAGGFAEVYLGWDRRLKREVAIKAVRADLLGSTDTLERFRREAESVARLRHPHVVPVYAVGEAHGLGYLIMPCIRGESLAAAMTRDDRWSFAEVSRILREAAGALAEAHRNGIVHRDVKPENIMLDGPGRRVMVMDFGIAKAADDQGSALTGTGMIVGTPLYMSPEQAAGERRVDHLADQYSLALVGYRLLTGQLPFESGSARAVLARQISEVPAPVRDLRPDVPIALASVIERALEKDPTRRWPSMDEFAEAIARIATDIAGEYRTTRREPSLADRWATTRQEALDRPVAWMGACVVGIVLFTVAYARSEVAASRRVLGERDELYYASRTELANRGIAGRFAERRDFQYSDAGFGFLEQAVGRDSAERLAMHHHAIWSWTFTFYRSDAEIWHVQMSSGARLTWMNRSLPDSARVPTLSSDSARSVTEAFLATRGYPAATLRLERSSTSQRVVRTDHQFIFVLPERSVAHAGDTAWYQLNTTVAGDEIVNYSQSLRLPTGYHRGVSRTTLGELGAAGLVGLLALIVVVVIVLLRRMTRDTLQWGMATRRGGVAFAVTLLTYTLPNLPAATVGYRGSLSRLSVVVNAFFVRMDEAVMALIVTAFALVVAESLAYERRPDLFRGMREMSRGRLLIPEMVPAALRGYAFGLVSLAFVYGTLAILRRTTGLFLGSGPYLLGPFELAIPALGVLLMLAWTIPATAVLAFLVMMSSKRRWTFWLAVATAPALAALIRLSATSAPEVRVLLEGIAVAGAVIFVSRYGYLATVIGLFVLLGSPIAADMIWAGGPYTSSGLLGIIFLLTPAVLAAVAWERARQSGWQLSRDRDRAIRERSRHSDEVPSSHR